MYLFSVSKPVTTSKSSNFCFTKIPGTINFSKPDFGIKRALEMGENTFCGIRANSFGEEVGLLHILFVDNTYWVEALAEHNSNFDNQDFDQKHSEHRGSFWAGLM